MRWSRRPPPWTGRRPSRCRVWDSCSYPWDATTRAGRRAAGPLLDELSPILAPLENVKQNLVVFTNFDLKNALPRNALDLERRIPECGIREAYREFGLLPRHDRRPARRPGDRQGHAAALAGTLDGPAPDRGPVQQRIRLCLSEQSVLVLANDAAAVRGASQNGVRAALRGRGQHRRPACRPAGTGKSAGSGPR